jgi:hypothetical protein
MEIWRIGGHLLAYTGKASAARYRAAERRRTMALSRLREGKYKELLVLSRLIAVGLDVYPSAVDDQGIDCVLRVAIGGEARYWDIQIKGYRGYARVVGVDRKAVERKPEDYLLLLAFLHQNRADEVFFLTKRQVLALKDDAFGRGKDGGWGDIAFNRPQRERFSSQTIDSLPAFLDAQAGATAR